jgi:hypothetical protein
MPRMCNSVKDPNCINRAHARILCLSEDQSVGTLAGAEVTFLRLNPLLNGNRDPSRLQKPRERPCFTLTASLNSSGQSFPHTVVVHQMLNGVAGIDAIHHPFP